MIPFRILSGKVIDLEDISKADIDINHIAHALSMQCRYNGQIKEFYSVAQHSTFVADYLYKETNNKLIALCGLLHDAAEAYIGDIVTPIKEQCNKINDLEGWILHIILLKYDILDIYCENEKFIHESDKKLYDLEVDYFFGAGKYIYDEEEPCENMIILRKAFFADFIFYRGVL